MRQKIINVIVFIAAFIISYSVLNSAPATPSGANSPSRAVARNSRPSEAETAVTQPKRGTTSMQPNAGRPTEINREALTRGVPKYPEPKASAPKSSVRRADGTTPTIKGSATSSKPTGEPPNVKRPDGGVPAYPLPNSGTPKF